MSKLPPGAQLIEHFVTKDEEDELIKWIEQSKWNREISRQTQHYGYRYEYKTRTLKPADPIPPWLATLSRKIEASLNLKETFDQVIINRYQPGEGIAPHVDHVKLFGPVVVSLSLQTPAHMDFKNQSHPFNESSVLLPSQSLLVLKDEARYSYTHGLKCRDDINFSYRTSITFRTVLLAPKYVYE